MTENVTESKWEDIASEYKDYIDQATKLKEVFAAERERRERNLKAKQLSEEELMMADSSFKKNNGLIRKLKSITAKDKEALCAEIRKVNQSKYVSEVVTAIADSQLKGKDIPAAVEISSLLHQRYADFAPGMKAALIKAYNTPIQGEDSKGTVARRRSCLRLIIELHLAGVFDDLPLIKNLVRELTGAEFEKGPEGYLMTLLMLTSVAKIGRTQIIGLPLQPSLNLLKHPEPPQDAPEEVTDAWKKAQEMDKELRAESALRFCVSDSEATEIRTILTEAADKSFATLLAEHKKLRDLENENTKVQNAKGDLPDHLAADYENKRNAFDNLQRTVGSLAESLDKEVPPLPEDKIVRVKDGTIQVVDMSESRGPHPLYDDQETREFYEALPDLRSIVPPLLLGLAEEKEEAAESAGDKDSDQGSPKDTKHKSATVHKKMDALIARLRTCYTRDAADEIAVDFCYMNSKITRRRLVRSLCEVPKGCLPLIPFYARVAAILNQIFPDVATGIASRLEQEFNSLVKKKDAGTHSLEPRIANMRYMGELCKFKLINYGTVFTCLKQLLDDFTHMNIDAACSLIETAGSFLIRFPETQGRMESRLEQMNRLKNAKNLDSRHKAAIDNAYYQCKPPKGGVRRKRRPPMREYIRHLIFTVLKEDTIREVLKKLRGVPWDEEEGFVVHCILKANVKLYSQVPLVASLCSGLAKYNDSFSVNVIDSVFEEIQLGMECPGIGLYQHRIAYIRFLGELYNYKLIDSKTVFNTLYWILSFGRSTPEEITRLDPPGDAFRIKMVCTILETCGRYFNKGSAKKKLDRFIVYFQRYILSKPPLSMDIEFEISDVLDHLRPDLKRFQSFEEANEAVEEIEAELAVEEKSGSEVEEEETGNEVEEDAKSIQSVELDDDDYEVDDRGKPNAPEIDLEFEQGLQALLQEHQRLTPAHIKPVESKQQDDSQMEKMVFKVLMKRGGKEDRSKKVQVPMSVTMAVRQKEFDKQEEEDRSRIKERVLAAHERDEEEEALYLNFGTRFPKGRHPSQLYGGRRYKRR